MACYYVVISSTHLRDGQLRSIKGVFRGPIGASGARSEVEAGPSLYCELCNKQYERQQQYDNHTSSYDHHHRQRLKELKQREFTRLLGSRRQRRGREQRQQRVKGPTYSVAGLGPMFRSTTVALDASVVDSGVVTSYTKEPVTSQDGSSAQWLSSSPAEQDLSFVDIQQSHGDKPTDAPHHLIHNNQPMSAPSDTKTHMSASPRFWSETRVRPVCFSLPKRCSTLCHQSAAVFLQTSKERMTQTPDDVDQKDSSVGPEDPIDGAYDALKTTQEKPVAQGSPESTSLHRPKEPFYRVLSRDSTTVLLWPSEMVSYTRTAPSISFSVNPLLHNFRAGNTTTEVPVDKRTEGERSEPLVIKRDEQQQRQAAAQGGGAPSRHERDREDGGGQTASAVEVVAHCNSSNCDESALNLSHSSEFESHLVLPGKKRRRKRTKRGRRGMRRKKNKIKKRTGIRSRDEGPGRRRYSENTKEIRNDHKRADLLSHLPVSHFNRCNQLCSQVNSHTSRHPSQQSVSKWGQGFRKLHSGGVACSTAISLVPGSDIEIPRCPAITPYPVQSCTDVWEAHAERQQGENDVLQENAANEKELVGKRTFDEAFKRETWCCQNQNVAAGKPTADCISLHCDAITEQVTISLTNRGAREVTPNNKKPPRKKLKKAGSCMEHSLKFMCIRSDLRIQDPQETQEVKNPTTQMVTAIVKTNTNTGSHFVSRSNLCVEDTCITTCSCCHSTSTQTMENSASDCGSYPFEQSLNSASEKNMDNKRQKANNDKQVEETQCMTTVSKTFTDLGPAETHSCHFDCTNHFTNCNCAEKDTNDGVVNVVLISAHPEQTRKEDERKQEQETTKEEKKEENKRGEGKVQERRKMERSDRTKGEWACLPLPPPYLLHHTFLHQHFVPMCQPMPPYPPLTCLFSPHLPLLPPLLPLALYSSAPVPLIDRPFPLPAFPSMQSGGPPLYGPPPPALVPTQLIFSKSAAFSIS